MIELYPALRSVHIGAVILSGGVFALRGAAVLAGAHWPMAKPLRLFTYGVDTVLLAAALGLAMLIRQYPFVHGWLTVKVVLLAAYIGLGTFALKRARTRAVRAACFVAALLVYGAIIGVARAHHPWGILARWLG